MTTAAFIDAMAALGYHSAVVPLDRLDDLEAELRELGQGALKTGYIGWRAQGLDKYKPKDLPFQPRSIVVMAKASPAARVRIETGTMALDVLTPPTYVGSDAYEAGCLHDAAALLEKDGQSAAPAGGLPLKLLAVHCGLGRYGRNNICYVDGLGSYASLFALYTDLPSDADPWIPVRLLDACAHCTACVTACPTQAIDAGRAVIDADRCLCSLNERMDPFPDWLDPKVHHTLVGCMRCQACCPADAAQRDNVVDAGTLSADAVRQVLYHGPDDRPTCELIARAEAIGMAHYLGPFQRNLKALIDASEPARLALQ